MADFQSNIANSQIISENELCLKICSAGLVPLKVQNSECNLCLCMSIDEFITFAKGRVGEVFYVYTYVKKQTLFITGDTIDNAGSQTLNMLSALGITCDFDWFLDGTIEGSIDEELCEDFSNQEKELVQRVLRYNRTVDSRLLARPLKLELSIILNGCLIGVVVNDDWTLDSEHFKRSHDALCDILNEFEKDYEAELAEQEIKRQGIHDKLEKELLDNRDFMICTNVSLRRNFTVRLWGSEDFLWIHEGFSPKRFDSSYPPSEFFDFIEMTYRKYRLRKQGKLPF